MPFFSGSWCLLGSLSFFISNFFSSKTGGGGGGGGATCRQLGQEGKPAARNRHAVCRHDYAIDLATAGTDASLTQVDTRAAGGNRDHCRLQSIKLRTVMQQVRAGSIKLRTVMKQVRTGSIKLRTVMQQVRTGSIKT